MSVIRSQQNLDFKVYLHRIHLQCLLRQMISAEVEGSNVGLRSGKRCVDGDGETDGAGVFFGDACGGTSFGSAFFLRVMAMDSWLARLRTLNQKSSLPEQVSNISAR